MKHFFSLILVACLSAALVKVSESNDLMTKITTTSLQDIWNATVGNSNAPQPEVPTPPQPPAPPVLASPQPPAPPVLASPQPPAPPVLASPTGNQSVHSKPCGS